VKISLCTFPSLCSSHHHGFLSWAYSNCSWTSSAKMRSSMFYLNFALETMSSPGRLLVFTLLQLVFCIYEFHKHVTLIRLQKRRNSISEISKVRRNVSIRWLFLIQLAMNCEFFVIGMDVLREENNCAFCIGCVEMVDRIHQCNPDLTQSLCESTGHTWCSSRNGPSFTPVYIASYGVASFALGLVFFQMMIHLFGDSRALASIQNHHNWSLVPIIVLLVNTWVCGSGATRISMRVLDVQVMRDIFPSFSNSYKTIFIVLCVTYALQVPVCFWLTRRHLIHLSLGGRRGSVVGYNRLQ